MPSSMIQIHGLVKKYGDRITVHWHPPGPAGGRRAVTSLCAQGGAHPWAFEKSYTNFTQIFSLSYDFSLPACHTPTSRTIGHVSRGRAHMRRTSGPPPSLSPHRAFVVSFAPRPM